jgi:hypothetical protein
VIFMPIKSPRRIYKITQITRNIDDDPDNVDTAPTQTVQGAKQQIFVKMKEGIGAYLGLVPIAYNDPIFTGVFVGNGLNKGATFRRNIGGFRSGSYTLIAKNTFRIGESIPNNTGGITIVNKNFRTITIGFPKGHSVNEVIAWLASTGKLDEIRAVRSPSGRQTDLFTPT